MAYPIYTITELSQWLIWADWSPAFGSFLDISRYGFNTVNFFDSAFKHAESPIPFSNGYNRTDDGMMAPTDLIIQGQLHSAPADDLALAIFDINNGLINMNDAKHSYVALGLWNGSTKTFYRKYVDPITSRIPMVSKTRQEITGPVQLFFRCSDPGIYEGTSETDTIVVVNGNGNKGIIVAGNVDTKRMTLTIIKTTADDPTNVRVSNGFGGPEFKINGALTVLNSSWKIDLFTTEIEESVGGVVTDASHLFTGERFALVPGGQTLYVMDAVTADFSVSLEWIGRFQ